MPDDDEVGEARNGIPAPLLGSALAAEGGEQTGEDHDDISGNGHQDVGTVEAGQQTEVKKKERGGQGPVDIASPVDLAVDLGEGVWDVVELLAHNDLVDRDSVASCHGKVGEGGSDEDQGGDDVVETTLLLMLV